jgi:hypothetical protein
MSTTSITAPAGARFGRIPAAEARSGLKRGANIRRRQFSKNAIKKLEIDDCGRAVFFEQAPVLPGELVKRRRSRYCPSCSPLGGAERKRGQEAPARACLASSGSGSTDEAA